MHRCHPGLQLLTEITGEVPDLLTTHGNKRPVHGHPPVAAKFENLLKRGGESKERLPRPGHPHHRHRRNVRVHEKIQSECLAGVLRLDPEDMPAPGNSSHDRSRTIVNNPTETRLGSGTVEDDELVDDKIRACDDDLPTPEQLVNDLTGNVDLSDATV